MRHKSTDTSRNNNEKEIYMNEDQVKGQWNQIKGKAKKAWGELTDNDFKMADGSADKLYGIIQKKFGDTKDAIKTKLDKLLT